MKILAVFPSTFEAAPTFKAANAKARLGAEVDLAGNVRAFVSGARSAAAAKRLGVQIGKYKPQVVVLLGFGGACSRKLKPADIVFETSDERLMEIFSSLGARPGKIACSATAADDQKKLGLEREGFDAVDMESIIFEQAAKAAGARFAHVRCISDAYNSPLPADVMDSSLNPDTGAIEPLRMVSLANVKKYPTLLIGLIKFGLKMIPVNRRWAKFCSDLTEKLKEMSNRDY